MPSTGKPLLGSQILDDTFEKLTDQGKTVAQQFKTLVTNQPQPDSSESQPDSSEPLAASHPAADPQQNQTQSQGLNPQQLAQKRGEEDRLAQFHRQRVETWDQESQQLKREEEAKRQQLLEAEEERKQLEIQQLEEQPVQPPSGPPPKGSALMPAATRQRQGTSELSKRPTN